MRPHILWFDESYTNELHRVDVIRSTMESDIDALIVVGTALATSLALRIVKSVLKKDILTIDINLEPVWTVGHSIQVVEKAESALPDLLMDFM